MTSSSTFILFACLMAVVAMVGADSGEKEMIEQKSGKYVFVPSYRPKGMFLPVHYGFGYPKKGYQLAWGMPAMVQTGAMNVDLNGQGSGNAGMQPRAGESMYGDDMGLGNGGASEYGDSGAGYERRRRRIRRRF